MNEEETKVEQLDRIEKLEAHIEELHKLINENPYKVWARVIQGCMDNFNDGEFGDEVEKE